MTRLAVWLVELHSIRFQSFAECLQVGDLESEMVQGPSFSGNGRQRSDRNPHSHAWNLRRWTGAVAQFRAQCLFVPPVHIKSGNIMFVTFRKGLGRKSMDMRSRNRDRN